MDQGYFLAAELFYSMPFTPYHFGPALLFGIILFRYIDFTTFVVANLIIDWRAALVLFNLWMGPRHGWVHTFIGASIMSVILFVVMNYMRKEYREQHTQMSLGQVPTKIKILLAAFAGTFLHVAIDSFHHPRMEPFMPFSLNPLLGIAGTQEVRQLTTVCGILGLFALILFPRLGNVSWEVENREN